MRPDYRVAPGWGVAYDDLDLFAPQPRCPGGIKPAARTYGTSAKVHQRGMHAELLWNVLPNATVYQALLAQCNLTLTNLEQQVTVNLRNGIYTYGRYNAIAVLPEPGKDVVWDSYFIHNVVLLFRNLVAL